MEIRSDPLVLILKKFLVRRAAVICPGLAVIEVLPNKKQKSLAGQLRLVETKMAMENNGGKMAQIYVSMV